MYSMFKEGFILRVVTGHHQFFFLDFFLRKMCVGYYSLWRITHCILSQKQSPPLQHND